MRVLIVTFALVCALAGRSRGTAAELVKRRTEGKEDKKHRAGGQEPREEAGPAAEKATSRTAVGRAEAACPKPGTDKDKEEFDVSEVPPVVTHHQITLDGKAAEVHRHHRPAPHQARRRQDRSRDVFCGLHAGWSGRGKASADFCLQRRPGLGHDLAPHGSAGPAAGRRCSPTACCRRRLTALSDNPSTLLDKSDVVLVDAMSTGFSRAANAELAKKFLGVKGDIDAFSEFIRLYLTRYERWSSPLFLFGESYGTTRAAGIAGNLADQGISFNGITLLSTALSFQTLEYTKSNDQPYILLIPTFTMIAGYHKKLPPDLMQDMDKARQESEQWAATEYTQALAKGDAITPEERQKVIDQMARYTGLSKEVLDQANLRIDVEKFTHYLLLDQKLRVGRLDGRFTGPDPDGVLDTPFYDPTEAATLPPFTSVFNNYVRTELGYKTDMPYQVFPADEDFFEKAWNWGSAIGGFPDTATALRQAIVKNPYLKVLVMEGFYDLATPFYAADYTVDHLNLSPQYRKNISFATYGAGTWCICRPTA